MGGGGGGNKNSYENEQINVGEGVRKHHHQS